MVVIDSGNATADNPALSNFSMVNERHVQNRYNKMSHDELVMRSGVIAHEQSQGLLSRGMRTYRRRIGLALEHHSSQQKFEHLREVQQEELPRGLSNAEIYSSGKKAGKEDARTRIPSKANSIRDPLERQGYNDGYEEERQGRMRSWNLNFSY